MTDGTPVTKNLEENEVWFRSRCEGCSDIKLQPMRLGKDGSVSALAIYVENTVPNLILEESVLGRMFIDMVGKDPKEVYQAVEANSLGLSEAQPLQTREEGMNAMLAGNLRVGKNQYSTDPKKNPEYRYESRRADRRCPVKYKAGTGIYERAGISGSAGTDPAGH